MARTTVERVVPIGESQVRQLVAHWCAVHGLRVVSQGQNAVGLRQGYGFLTALKCFEVAWAPAAEGKTAIRLQAWVSPTVLIIPTGEVTVDANAVMGTIPRRQGAKVLAAMEQDLGQAALGQLPAAVPHALLGGANGPPQDQFGEWLGGRGTPLRFAALGALVGAFVASGLVRGVVSTLLYDVRLLDHVFVLSTAVVFTAALVLGHLSTPKLVGSTLATAFAYALVQWPADLIVSFALGATPDSLWSSHVTDFLFAAMMAGGLRLALQGGPPSWWRFAIVPAIVVLVMGWLIGPCLIRIEVGVWPNFDLRKVVSTVAGLAGAVVFGLVAALGRRR